MDRSTAEVTIEPSNLCAVLPCQNCIGVAETLDLLLQQQL